MNKVLIISLLALIALTLSGCTQSTPVCGDGICSDQESNMDSSYYCTNDCSLSITPKSPGATCRYNSDCKDSSGNQAANEVCCNGKCMDTTKSICCDGAAYDKNKYGCCDNKPFLLASQFCCGGKVYNSSQAICCGGAGYDKTKVGCCNDKPFLLASQICCGGKIYASDTVGCCDGKPFMIATQGCCNKEIYELKTEDCCKTTASGGKGEKYTKADSCCILNSAGDVVIESKNSWSPSTDTVCEGVEFCQTNLCGETRRSTGTNPKLCCSQAGKSYPKTFSRDPEYWTVNQCQNDKEKQKSLLRQSVTEYNNSKKSECESGGPECVFVAGDCDPITINPDCKYIIWTDLVHINLSCSPNPMCTNKKQDTSKC